MAGDYHSVQCRYKTRPSSLKVLLKAQQCPQQNEDYTHGAAGMSIAAPSESPVSQYFQTSCANSADLACFKSPINFLSNTRGRNEKGGIHSTDTVRGNNNLPTVNRTTWGDRETASMFGAWVSGRVVMLGMEIGTLQEL